MKATDQTETLQRKVSAFEYCTDQAFECKDEYFVLAIGNDQQWKNFCRATGLNCAMDGRLRATLIYSKNKGDRKLGFSLPINT